MTKMLISVTWDMVVVGQCSWTYLKNQFHTQGFESTASGKCLHISFVTSFSDGKVVLEYKFFSKLVGKKFKIKHLANVATFVKSF